MKNLLTKIVNALVESPEQVHVNAIEGSQNIVLELRVAKRDLGKVIGKQGKTANAIRAVLNATSGKVGKRYMLKIVE